MAQRSIFFDRFGTLQINAHCAVIDKSDYLERRPHAPDTFVSPYFKKSQNSQSKPITCSLLEEEAILYGYKIPPNSPEEEAFREPMPSTSRAGPDQLKNTCGHELPTRQIRFKSVVSTGLAAGTQSCKRSQPQPSTRKSVKWDEPAGSKQPLDSDRHQSLKNELDRAVPKTTLRSAIASCKQYPSIPSTYTFNKYAHLFGLKRKPEFRITESRAVANEDDDEDDDDIVDDDDYVRGHEGDIEDAP